MLVLANFVEAGGDFLPARDAAHRVGFRRKRKPRGVLQKQRLQPGQAEGHDDERLRGPAREQHLAPMRGENDEESEVGHGRPVRLAMQVPRKHGVHEEHGHEQDEEKKFTLVERAIAAGKFPRQGNADRREQGDEKQGRDDHSLHHDEVKKSRGTDLERLVAAEMAAVHQIAETDPVVPPVPPQDRRGADERESAASGQNPGRARCFRRAGTISRKARKERSSSALRYLARKPQPTAKPAITQFVTPLLNRAREKKFAAQTQKNTESGSMVMTTAPIAYKGTTPVMSTAISAVTSSYQRRASRKICQAVPAESRTAQMRTPRLFAPKNPVPKAMHTPRRGPC